MNVMRPLDHRCIYGLLHFGTVDTIHRAQRFCLRRTTLRVAKNREDNNLSVKKIHVRVVIINRV